MFLTSMFGLWRAMPFLRSQASLVRQVAFVEKERDEYKSAAEALKAAADGWQTFAEQLSSEINELRSEVHSLRSQLAVAILYIADSIEADRNNSARPPVPESLRPLIQELSHFARKPREDEK